VKGSRLVFKEEGGSAPVVNVLSQAKQNGHLSVKGKKKDKKGEYNGGGGVSYGRVKCTFDRWGGFPRTRKRLIF